MSQYEEIYENNQGTPYKANRASVRPVTKILRPVTRKVKKNYPNENYADEDVDDVKYNNPNLLTPLFDKEYNKQKYEEYKNIYTPTSPRFLTSSRPQNANKTVRVSDELNKYINELGGSRKKTGKKRSKKSNKSKCQKNKST